MIKKYTKLGYERKTKNKKYQITTYFRLATVATQSINVQHLNKTQNLLQLKLGPCRIINSYYNLLHIVNLTEYEESITKTEDILNTLKSHTRLDKLLTISYKKLNTLKSTYNSLRPIGRNKRGVINGIGTAIKFITGNMDANDAFNINTEIDRLKEFQHKNQQVNSQQHFLNTQMINRLKNMTKHINDQKERISSYLTHFSNMIQKDNNELDQYQIISQINFNIDTLTNHLKDILNSIMLAKVNIISKLIFNREEIREIINIISGEGKEISSENYIYRLLSLEAYYNNSNIIFNIKIPQIEETKYEFFNLIPLPINKTLKIRTKPYIAYSKEKIQFFDTACQNIENTFYCEKTSTIATENSTCIGAIFQNRRAECHLDTMEFTSTIQQPRNNIILLINIPKTLIEYNCSSPNTSVIEGTAVIIFDNCSIKLNGLTYLNKKLRSWDTIKLLPPPTLDIQPKSIATTITIPRLQEFNYNLNTSMIELQNNNSRNTITTGTILILLGILTTAAIFLAIKRNVTIKYVSNPAENIVTAASDSLWPSLYSKGGGVTCAHTHTYPNTPPAKPRRQPNISE